MPEIETADLSQPHAGLNLPQLQTDCLLRTNSSATILFLINTWHCDNNLDK